MVANPEVTVQDRAEVHELVARVASPEEKAALWPLATAVWPAYDDYQEGIPMMWAAMQDRDPR
jgi:deazaflavin-dependent oxidoreductase (nitroreductase family)